MTPKLNLAATVPCTEVEGPGRRFVVWVQGCNLGCEGCCNGEMLAFKPKRVCEPSEVAVELDAAEKRFGIEGLTLLGGEPFLQARGLAVLARHAQARKLSVMVFSGFTLARLRTLNLPGSEELLSATDLLVDGPFVPALHDSLRNWVGSRNQRFHFLTDRYGPDIIDDPSYRSGMEVRFSSDGSIKINGQPSVINALNGNPS